MPRATLTWRTADEQIAHRLESVGDLRSVGGAVLVVVGVADRLPEPPAYAERLWLTLAPMTETVKRIAGDGTVVATVPREVLRVAGLPLIAPAAVLARCAARVGSVEELVSELLASGLPVEPLPGDPPDR